MAIDADLAQTNAPAPTEELKSWVAAIRRSHGVIEFDLAGNILDVNDNYLAMLGYTLEEMRGRHHHMFLYPGDPSNSHYDEFWKTLAAGQPSRGEFRRRGKMGEVWMQATYNPIVDQHGRVTRIVKMATDITDQRLRDADYEGQIHAIRRSQGVIEFDLDGKIRYVNERYLKMVGYSEQEVIGHHHSLLASPSEADADAYAAFWETLRRGTPIQGEFRRRTKDGHTIWIKATYTPILDLAGRPFKVVKYAIDATAAVRSRVSRAFARRLVGAISATNAQTLSLALGRNIVEPDDAADVDTYVEVYNDMGLGRLDLQSQQDRRWTFRGHDLIERQKDARMATCNMTRGYLEAAVSAHTSLPTIGTETKCESRRDAACIFVIETRPPTSDAKAELA